MVAAEPADHWGVLKDALATARVELLAAASDAASAAESEAYLMRLMTASLDDVFLGHLRSERGLTRALPTRGAPNPDYIMWHAGVDQTQRYRLTGCLHDSERVGIGLYSFSANGAALLAGYAAFDRTTVNKDGCFSIEIGTDLKGPGTLAVTPSARVLLIRVLHRAQGRQCALTLEGGSTQSGFSAMQGSCQEALARAAQSALRAVRLFLQWTRVTSANPNCILVPPASMADEVQGDPDTLYGLGYYELSEGEWLEVLIPAGRSGYWSVHAYNHWCESLPGAGVHDLNAIPDTDGRVRVRIGPSLPSSQVNRIDTLGRKRGALVFRAIGATSSQFPQAMLRR